MFRIVRVGLITALVAVCAGCGGGGGGGGSSSPVIVIPQSPTFTSSATVSVRENFSDIVYRPMATDPQNDALTYGAISGPDAARFTTNTVTREIRFAALPDFERPADANGDNVYNISFTASDGPNTTLHNVAVTVTDAKPGFRVRRFVTAGYYSSGTVGYPDGSGRFATANRSGMIFANGLSPEVGSELLGNLNDTPFFKLENDWVRGIAFSPNFTVDRTFYAIIQPTNSFGVTTGDFRLVKIRMSTTVAHQLDMSTADEIMRLPPTATFMTFDSSGYLYIGTTASSYFVTNTGPQPPSDNATAMLAQDPNSPAGKILRIDPSADAFPNDPIRDYAIPPSNPFASGGGMPEVYAMGVSYPVGADFDHVTQSFTFGDRGSFEDSSGRPITRQEVNRLPLSATQAPNFGWPHVLGSTPKIVGMSYPGFTGPVVVYDETTAVEVIGGITYRGPIEDFQGYYFLGDERAEKLWGIRASLLSTGTPVMAASFEDVRSQFLPAPVIPITPDGPYVMATDTRGNLIIGGVEVCCGVTPTATQPYFYIVEPIQ